MAVEAHYYVIDEMLKTQCILLGIQVWLNQDKCEWNGYCHIPDTGQWIRTYGHTPDEAVKQIIEQLPTIGDRFK